MTESPSQNTQEPTIHEFSDASVRQRVASDLSSTLFVEAGAGTGKTTVLVSRIVELIRSGADVSSIVAITFTEAAARALADRVEKALREAATGPDRELFERALLELDAATITTLHGFAHRLLSEYPMAIGLPPRFAVMDAAEAAVQFSADWDEFFAELLEDANAQRALLYAETLGLNLHQLREVAQEFSSNHDRLDQSFGPSKWEPVPFGEFCTEVGAFLEWRDDCAKSDDKLLIRIETLGEWLEENRDWEHPLQQLAALMDAGLSPGRDGNKNNWLGREVDDVRTEMKRLGALRDAIMAAVRRDVLIDLCNPIREFVLGCVAKRRATGELTYHDLLVLARELLRTSSSARASLQERYQFVLIDEFQDTDPLQIEIAALLCSPISSVEETRHWTEMKIEAGRMFVVGDPKQSIYRFRRADLLMYHDAAQTFGKEWLTLVTNFRSLPPITEVVNHVHSYTMGEGEHGVQATYVSLAASRADEVTGPSVATFGGESDDIIANIREQEAGEIAALIKKINSERWIIHDNGEPRRVKLSDICILLPSRQVLPFIERALEGANTPLRIESQTLLYATNEVHDLIAMLRAIDDSANQIALLSALRTPILACSDLDLADYVAAGGTWDLRPMEQRSLTGLDEWPGASVVADALDYLYSLWTQRHWNSASAMLERIIEERQVMSIALAYARPRDRWRRIRFLVCAAQSHAEKKSSDLRSFIGFVDQQLEEEMLVNEYVIPEQDDDAVRINTIHGSKGMEYPIVILAGMNALNNLQPRVVWADSPEIRVGTSDGYFVTEGFDGALDLEKTKFERERDRLLYVGMTRARDHLIMSLHRKARRLPEKCMAARLAAALDKFECPHLELTPPAPDEHVETTPADLGFDDALILQEQARWEEQHRTLLARAGQATSIAATALTVEGDREPQEPIFEPGGDGAAIGSTVHEVMHFADFDAELSHSLCMQQATLQGIPQRAGDVETLSRRLLSSDSVGLARTSRHWREVPIAVQLDDITLEGFIDLLIETDDGFIVVDYKTDRWSTEADIERLKTHYRPQLAAYALALTRILGKEVTEARLVFAYSPDGESAREETLDVGPEAQQGVLDQIALQTTINP